MGDAELGQEGVLTYVGTYGGDDRLPVDRLLRRENHPLGVRRSEATKIATEEAAEAATSNKRWTFGAAAGALLVAGTFAAGALGISGGATPVAGSAPEHAPASPGHNPSGPVVGAPAPGQDTEKQQKNDQRNQQTTPSSANGPATNAPAAPADSGTDQSGGQTGGTADGTSVETPAPAPEQPAPEQPAPAPAPEQPSDSGGGLGDVLTPVTDTVGDVLTPVTDVVGGVLSPLTGGSTAKTQSAPAPSGPALTMIDPLGDLLAS